MHMQTKKFLWFCDEPPRSQYLGWSVGFITNLKTSNLCLNDQAYNCLIHFSSYIIIIHNASWTKENDLKNEDNLKNENVFKNKEDLKK